MQARFSQGVGYTRPFWPFHASRTRWLPRPALIMDRRLLGCIGGGGHRCLNRDTANETSEMATATQLTILARRDARRSNSYFAAMWRTDVGLPLGLTLRVARKSVSRQQGPYNPDGRGRPTVSSATEAPRTTQPNSPNPRLQSACSLPPPEIDKPQPKPHTQPIARTNYSGGSKKCIPSGSTSRKAQ